MATAVVQNLVSKMTSNPSNRVSANELTKAELVNFEENSWPVGTETVGMKGLSKAELIKRMFKRTEINGRTLNNPVYGICLDTNKGPKVLYINSLTKTLVPYILEDGIPIQSDEEPVHSDSEVYKAVMACKNVDEVINNVFVNHELKADSLSSKVRVARYDAAGNVVGVKPATYVNFVFGA